MTLRITLHIFQMTFALFIDAVPLTMAAYFQTLSLRLTKEIVNLYIYIYIFTDVQWGHHLKKPEWFNNYRRVCGLTHITHACEVQQFYNRNMCF